MLGKVGTAMAKQKPRKKGIARVIRAIIILVILGVIGLFAWNYFAPMMTADSITTYESYTVETGDIETVICFSGTLDVKNSETYSSSSSDMTTIKEIYVESGDEVSEGDALVLLSNGELLEAGFDGVVNDLRVSVGDWARSGMSVVQICDLENLEVTMDVDEYDVKSLTAGQTCTVRIISLDMDFETTISHVDRVSSSSGTLAYYSVTCDVTVPEEVLPGMKTVVIIPDESVEDVIMVSMAALGFDDDDNPYVLMLNDDGDYETVYVETGLSDGMNVEITSGLEVGDVVYAVSGTESVSAAFSLSDIYIAIFGEKVVINSTSTQGMGSMDMSSMTMTGEDGSEFSMEDIEGMEDFTEGEMPEGMSEEDMESWSEGEMPEGMSEEDMPDMEDMPDTDDVSEEDMESMGDTQETQEIQSTEETEEATQDVDAVQDLEDIEDELNTTDEQTTDTNAEP